MAHNLRQFRRTRFRWRTFLGLALISGLVVLRCSSSSTLNSTIDVTQVSAESGNYPLLRITDTGRLEVEVEKSTDSTSQRTQPVQIELLGVEIQRTEEAVALLRSTFDAEAQIEVRFDRRRISPDSTVLLAYAFHESTCLNVELVRRGLATDATHPSDAGPMIRQIKKAEQAAKREQLGVWSN